MSFATNQAVVSVGGTEYPAAYLRGATFTAGDLVYVSYQSGSWVIHGALAGVGPNLMANANPSFEDSAPGTTPVQWILADVAGTSTATTMSFGAAPDGSQVAAVGTLGGGATAYLYSALAIPVTAGDTFSVSALSGGAYEIGDTLTADSAIVALWFANATDLYPTTSSADTVINAATDIVAAPPFTTLSGSVAAPVTGFMRIALRAATVGTQQVLFDQVIVRET
ncbi:hypothetical protein [Streptomyces sp. NPDC046332]|uniref:hypothetical protein n=1 Tax=unclassified Streptomyces TaxID=2593676 RepID=UPI00340C7DAD